MNEDRSIFYFDGYNEIRDVDNECVFKTDEISNDSVIMNVVILWNKHNGENCFGPDGALDMYLLDEERCDQEEREIIIESLWDFFYK